MKKKKKINSSIVCVTKFVHGVSGHQQQQHQTSLMCPLIFTDNIQVKR